MQTFFKNLRNVWFQLGLALVLNIITWAYIYLKIKPTAEPIPLHYNIFYGIDFVDKGYFIYFIPAIGLVILILNYFLARYLRSKEEFGSKILVAVVPAIQAFILVAILFLKTITVI